MEEKEHPSPARVADAFVKQYYVILNECPENLHKFYTEPSLLGWPGDDGVVTPVTTLSGINEKVMSSDYKYCSVEVKTTDAQESLEGGIIVTVTGCLTGTDNVKKNYSQTFFLAKQEKGFFVLNDILRFFYVCEPMIEAAGTSDVENDQPAPTHDSVPSDTCDGPTSLNFKAALQNGKVEEASDLSISVKNLANGAAASTPSIPSDEKISVSPEKDAKPQPVDANEKALSFVKPATNLKTPPVVTPALNVASKMTYASVLAKEAPAVSPKVAAATSNVSKQAVASPTTKPSSSPRGDVSPNVSTPRGGVSKAPTSSTAEGKGIYIANLPYDISKQGIIDVVKQFGPVRRYMDTVQIRRHPEDGFCCGFVEFESADSAERAVRAHHVMFGDKEAYIQHKRPPRGNNGGARSPTRRVQRNGNAGVVEVFAGNNGGARSPTRRVQRNGNSNGNAGVVEVFAGNNGGARSPTRRVQRNGNGNGNAGVVENGDWIHYSQRPRQAGRDHLK